MLYLSIYENNSIILVVKKMDKRIFLIGCLTLIIDQVSKLLIDSFIEAEKIVQVIPNFFYLTKVGNTGAAFSILEGRTFLLSITSVICIILLIKISSEFTPSKLSSLAFGLLFGGILGNFSDRMFLGYVRDFLKFDIFGYNFPIFNIADTAIVIGVILLLFLMMKVGGKDEFSCKRIR